MTFDFSDGSGKFRNLLSVSWEVLVLHGYDCICWVAKSCTSTAYWWLIRDSHPSLRTLWSAVIKLPKFSARGTASPVRFLQGALLILVLLRTAQFRSFKKWTKIRCFLDTTFVERSETESWEVLAGVSLDANIPSSSTFSLKSSNHSGKSRNKSSCTGKVSFFYFCFFGLPWDLATGLPVLECWYLDVVLLLDLTKSLQLCLAVTM